jgi:nucleoside-diphosphate-sugar epimerase
MRLLVLGGTVFLGRAVARQALAAGHTVTCAARGTNGAPVDGVTFVRVDRDDPAGLAPLSTEPFDAVVDVARRPSHVRRAVEALAGRVAHFTFVSTGSVYADHTTPGQRVDTAPVLPPAPPELDDPSSSPAAYGACKVACEEAVLGGFGADRAFVCRAGLIVGPEDEMGRFPYWVGRFARGGEILVPGAADHAVQLVDVRDLADWIVDSAETGRAGLYDGIGPPMSRSAFFAGIADGVGTAEPQLTWVPQEFLAAQEVQPWDGPRSLPMWLPVPEFGGFLTRDVSASVAAGLSRRPLADTARETYVWQTAVSQSPNRPRPAGLTADEEASILAAWHAESAGS